MRRGFCCCIAGFFAIFFPPIAVLLAEGCGPDFCLNLMLTCLVWLPGVIHALLVISRPEPRFIITQQPVVVNVA